MEVTPLILQILKSWWWLVVPIILWFPLKSLYLWWIRWEVWYPKFKWIVLEIKPPKEILKPFKAMENIYSILWGIMDIPNWREIWCEGELPLGGGLWFSFEIAGFGGEIHFYMRIPEIFRNTAESAVYSQYPEAEIALVDDYTKYVPQDIPNKDWDLYGEDFSLMKEDPYPIKTYSMFFEKEVEEKRLMEEKRLDPMDSLIEDLSRLKSGEQAWIQIVTMPVNNELIPWRTRGQKLVDQIRIYRGAIAAKKPKPMLQEAAEVLISGKPPEAQRPREKVSLEEEKIIEEKIKLTPGERDIVYGIENKIAKHGYQTWIRALHIYKRDGPYSPGFYKTIRSYFNQFLTENLNAFVFWGPSRSRIHYWLRNRRLYLRKRRQFRNYVTRLPSTFPRSMKGELLLPFSFPRAPRGPGIRGTIILNIEELATIYHLPAKIISPAVPRIEAKKGGPPAGLPVEEYGK